jgi:hypothetical protein
MRAFYGGQIKQDCRGDLAVVIRQRPREGAEVEPHYYSTFLYSPTSEEFIHLTGVGSINQPIDRVFIGVSHNIGEDIALQTNNRPVSRVDLERIDRLVVTPHFLEKNLPKPDKIVLRATLKGYEVVQTE